jgi:hypothetical protein
VAARLRLTIDGDPEPDAARWAAMGQALWAGDAPADAVIAWMREVGREAAWAWVHRACTEGPQVLPPDAQALSALLRDHAQPPAWMNLTRLRRGARVLQGTGAHGLMVLRDAGLMAGYQASAINQTLIKTGALERGAHQRLAQTTRWWLACTEEDGLLPGREGHRLTLHVRLMHALVRDQLARSPDWDAAQWGLPINQLDMQATYLAFSAVHLLGLRMTGMAFSAEDANAVMHLWRCMAHLMGVDEAWLCDDEATGRLLMYQNLLTQAPPDDSSTRLARALMDEPLTRPYPVAAGVLGRFDRERHLSLLRWLIGRDGMERLGLPTRAPWYPLAMLAPTFAGSMALRAAPWLEGPWLALARRQQMRHLDAWPSPPDPSSGAGRS